MACMTMYGTCNHTHVLNQKTAGHIYESGPGRHLDIHQGNLRSDLLKSKCGICARILQQILGTPYEVLQKGCLSLCSSKAFQFYFSIRFLFFFRVIYTFCLNRVFSCMSLLVGNSPGAVAVQRTACLLYKHPAILVYN